MAKKIDLDDDDFDFDFDFDDDFEMDPALTNGADNRTPIQKLRASAVRTFNIRENGLQMSANLARNALPKGYSKAFDTANDMKNQVTSIYDNAAKYKKPALDAVKSGTRKVLPVASGFMPKKIAEKLKKFSTEEESRSYSSDEDYDPKESEIKSTLETIFGAQRIDTDQREKVDDIHRNIDREISKKQFTIGANLQNNIASGIARLVGYQDTVLDKYYRKSLELQHRHYFTAKEHFELTKAQSIDVLSNLTAIVKNTALPNEAKVNLSEEFTKANTNKLIGVAQDAFSNRLGSLPNRLGSVIKRSTDDIASGIKEGLDMFTMGGDDPVMQRMMMEEGSRGILTDITGNFFKKRLPKYLDKLHPNANNKVQSIGNKASAWAERVPGQINRKLRKAEREDPYSIMGILSNMVGSEFGGRTERINHNLRDKATDPVPWDMLSRRTLVEIIPGFMSRQLEQVTNIFNLLSGKETTSERVVYSSQREQFVKESTALSDTKKELAETINLNIRSSIKEIVDFIDADENDPLTPTERFNLTKFLLEEARDQVDFDPFFFANESNYDWDIFSSETAKKIANHFQGAFGIEYKTDFFGRKSKFKMANDETITKQYERLANRFSSIKPGIGDFTDTFNTINANADKEFLLKIGALDEKGKVNSNYKENLINELFSKETPDTFINDVSQFTPELESFGKKGKRFKNLNNRVITTPITPVVNNTNSNIPVSNLTEDFSNKLLEKLSGNNESLLNGIKELSNRVTVPTETSNNDRLDALIQITATNGMNNEALLERIAIGVETIQAVDMGNYTGSSQKNLVSKNWDRTKWLASLPFKLHQKTAPIRNTLYPAITKVIGSGGKLALETGINAAKLGFNIGGKLAGFVGKQLMKAPERIVTKAGQAAKIAGVIKDVTKEPLGWAAGKVVDTGLWAGKKVVDTAIKVPGRLVHGLQRGGKIGQAIAGTGSNISHHASNLVGKIGGKEEWVNLYRKKNNDEPAKELYNTNLDRLKNSRLYNRARSFKVPESITTKIQENKVDQDLYNQWNNKTPLITITKLRNGEYYDANKGTVITKLEDITGPLKDKDGNFVLTTQDLKDGLFTIDGEKFKGKVNAIKDTIEKSEIPLLKRAIKLKNTIRASLSPMGLVSLTMASFTEAYENKENTVAKGIDKLYDYMKLAIPVEDSEAKEANRSGGVNDILKRRKAKLEADKTKAENVKKAKSSTTEKSEEKKPEKEGIVDKALNVGKKYWKEVGGAAGLLKAGKTFLGKQAVRTGLTAGAGAVGAEGLATGGTIAAEVIAGTGTAGALVTGAEVVVGGAAALAASPWVILGATVLGVGAIALGPISRRTKLEPIEMLRFLQYGVPVNNTDAIISIRYFEDKMQDRITVDKKGVPKVDTTLDKLFSEFASTFGNKEDDAYANMNWQKWFNKRFLPVWVKHIMVARELGGGDILDVDDDLATRLKQKFVMAVQFGQIDKDNGFNPLSINESPWYDIKLADNKVNIDVLTKEISNMSRRGANLSENNLDKIKATLPTVINAKSADAAKIQKALDDKQEQERQKVEKEKSFTDKALDWSKRGIEAVKAFGGKALEKGKQVWNYASNAAGKAGSWIKKNVIQPVSNSLAGLITSGESGREGYNAYNRGTIGNKILGSVGHRDLTKMTIAEILADMSRDKSNPQRLFAVGKYQMIPETLKDAIRQLGIDPSTTLFDENTQERLLASYLLDKKRKPISAFITGKSNDPKAAAFAASCEWASIADPNTGSSHYGNGNRASISSDAILGALSQSRNLYQQYVSQGLDPDDAYQKAVSTDPSTVNAQPILTSNTPGSSDNSFTNANNTGPRIEEQSSGPIGNNSVAINTIVPSAPVVSSSLSIPTKVNNQNPFTVANTGNIKEPSTNSMTEPLVTKTDSSSNVPDLSHISKATLQVGDSAAKQRDVQITEQQKTNELLTQYLSLQMSKDKNDAVKDVKMGAMETRLAKNTVMNNKQEVRPVINLNRNM